ncbi:phosphatase PAP2 family protein [Alphaproteobacteria bacterium]|nr:phosphatase PAP2 family protein [Alphaproteobacteria bacterium]
MNFFKSLDLKQKKILIFFAVAIFITFFIDKKLTLFFYSFNDPFKSFFLTATNFGDSLYYFILIFIFFLFLRPKKNISLIFQNLYNINVFAFYNLALSGIVTQIIKHIVGRPRPKILFSENQSLDFNILSFNSDFHSFPSGHSATIFSVIFIFYFLFPGFKKYLLAIGIFVGLTRFIIGAHYLSDVIAGCAVSYFVFIYLRNKFLLQKKLFIKKNDIIQQNKYINQISIICLNYIRVFYSNIIQINYYLKYFLLIISISIVFFIFPTIDISISGIFYKGDGNFFANSPDWNVYLLRKILLPSIILFLVLLPIIGIPYCLITKKKILTLTLNNLTYLLLTGILSLGIIVNVILKNLWGRVRPNDTIIFGGDQPFSIPWLKVSHCDHNCSFVSGDVSAFTLLLALILIFSKPNLSKYAFILILLISVTRIMEGGHFFSDVIMSFMITHFIIKILFDFFAKLPDNLNVDKISFFKK